MGYVSEKLAIVGQELEVLIMGKRWAAKIVEDSPYDPKNESIRVDG